MHFDLKRSCLSNQCIKCSDDHNKEMYINIKCAVLFLSKIVKYRAFLLLSKQNKGIFFVWLVRHLFSKAAVLRASEIQPSYLLENLVISKYKKEMEEVRKYLYVIF